MLIDMPSQFTPLSDQCLHCPSSEFLEPMAASTKRGFGSSGWFHYAACCL